MKTGKKIPALMLMLFAMFLLGGISNTKGIILNEVKNSFAMNLSQIGLVVFAFQWGFVIASFFAGYYCDKYGLKWMVLLGSAVMAIGLTGTGSASTVAFFLGFYLIVGLGMGAITVASTVVVPTLYPKVQAVMFNVSMGIYGIGMLVTPLILGKMFALGISWRYFYLGCASLMVLFIFYTLWIAIPNALIRKIQWRAFKVMLKNPQFDLTLLFLILYVSAEITFTNFLPNFLMQSNLAQATQGGKEKLITTVFSLFSLLYTFGRLFGGYLVKWIGERRALILFSGFSCLCLGISKMLVNNWVYLFSLCGIFFSVLFPTAVGVATNICKTAGSALGLVYVAAGVGGAGAGWLVGYISHRFSASLGFDLPVIFLAALFCCSLFIKGPSAERR